MGLYANTPGGEVQLTSVVRDAAEKAGVSFPVVGGWLELNVDTVRAIFRNLEFGVACYNTMATEAYYGFGFWLQSAEEGDTLVFA